MKILPFLYGDNKPVFDGVVVNVINFISFNNITNTKLYMNSNKITILLHSAVKEVYYVGKSKHRAKNSTV